jgi:hypothetical protein
MGLAEQRREPGQHRPVPEPRPLVHDLLEQADRLRRIAPLEMGAPEEAERVRGVHRVGRVLEAPPAGDHRGLRVAAGGLEPAGRPGSVGLQLRVGDQLGDALGLPRGGQRRLELAHEAVTERHAPVGGPEPPARLRGLEESDGLAAVPDGVREPPRPEAAAREDVVGLTPGHGVAGLLGLRDRTPGVLVGGGVIPQVAPDVPEPEVGRRP